MAVSAVTTVTPMMMRMMMIQYYPCAQALFYENIWEKQMQTSV
jgi:hypothetical protein